MSGPFNATNVIVKVTGTTVGVVNLLDMRFQYEGGAVQHVYSTDVGYISLAGRRCSFTLQRWFMTDSDTDLLYDLFNDKTVFDLTGEISGVGTSTFGISGCKASSWRPILGDANTIVGEEIAGEGTTWTPTTI